MFPTGKRTRAGPPASPLLVICWRQWRTERALRRRGLDFRTTDPVRLQQAYAAMTPAEFAAINGRQEWANWRTLPRLLQGRLPQRPLRVLDLGCGTGSSTQVLAYCCPPGSQVTGYEMIPALLEVARQRTYCHCSGQPVAVTFCCQAITEPLRQPEGTLVPAQSVDLVNASGLVGHHLTAATFAPLLAELQRVLAPAGWLALDVGPTLPARQLRSLLEAAGFRFLARRRSWLLDPTGQMLFQRQEK